MDKPRKDKIKLGVSVSPDIFESISNVVDSEPDLSKTSLVNDILREGLILRGVLERFNWGASSNANIWFLKQGSKEAALVEIHEFKNCYVCICCITSRLIGIYLNLEEAKAASESSIS